MRVQEGKVQAWSNIILNASPPHARMHVFLHSPAILHLSLTKIDLISSRLPSFPEGLAYDHKSGFVFVAQPNVDNVIAVNVTTGAVVFTIGKGYGNGFGQLNDPHDVALDGYGNLLVADKGNKRIAVFDASDGAPIISFHTPFEPLSVLVDLFGNVIVGGEEELNFWS